MSWKRVGTVGDCIRFGLDVEIMCRCCGRRVVQPPRDVLRALRGSHPRRWPMAYDFASVGRRLVCSVCGRRGARVTFAV